MALWSGHRRVKLRLLVVVLVVVVVVWWCGGVVVVGDGGGVGRQTFGVKPRAMDNSSKV